VRHASAVLAVLALAAAVHAPLRADESPATVVFVLRHAEAGATHGGDPGLGDAGRMRAAALADLLGSAGLTRLYASEYRRTQETLGPLAERLGIEVTPIPAAETERLLTTLRALPAGARAAVAAHSNTIPAIVRGLGGTVADTRDSGHGDAIDAAAYDRLFVVVLASAPLSFELRYGP
jgi:broad specificity phosphatase PhoE